MTTDELTTIDAIGPAYAQELADAGYESVADVAEADPADIDDVLVSADGAQIVDNAQDAGTGADTDADVRLFELTELTMTQHTNALYAMIDQQTAAVRTNDVSTVSMVDDAIETLLGDEPYELTLDQLTQLYTGLSNRESELRSTRGINSYVSDIRELRNEVQELRSSNWPDE